MGDAIGLVIDGAIEAGEDGTYAVRNPVRPAEIVFEAPSASAGQLDRAVAGARRAQPAWAALDFAERAELVGKAAAAAGDVVTSSDLATLLVREHGKVLWEAQFDSGTIAGMASAFVPLAGDVLAGRVLPGHGGRRTSVRAEPHGVVAAILPFNWPVSVLGNKLLPALLMGNTVVVKAPPTCPGAVLATTRALAEALPAGVVNAVNGPGPELGAALVGHRGVDMVSFTGGPSTGRAVMAGAAGGLTPLVLELGGNDPAIVAPDMEIDDILADRIVGAAFVTSGQVCMAVKRLYVPEDKVGAMVDVLVARVGTEVVGDGLAPETTMGPVHLPSAVTRVEGMLEDAADRGATVHRPARVRDEDAGVGGYLVSPAIVAGAPDEASIVRDEQFAPALPVLGYRDLDEAVARANDTEFGLCASIWTADASLAAATVGRLEAGTVFVNGHGTAVMDHRAPFGGWKQSGFGLELGPEGMAAFTRPKTVLELPPVDADLGAAVYDLVIRGGTLLDGTGAPARRADVAVAGGRVAAIGDAGSGRLEAAAELDATGMMVAPGFVDLHTHYDAQLAWDPMATPSPLHGVTTVVGGNCGFSLAPCGPEHADYLAKMMARVEGMPLAALEHLDWSWTSFGDWLGRFDGRIAVNAGFLVGHSALRRAAMGDEAVGSAATDAQVSAMVALLHRSLEEGALGLSTSQAHTHNDGAGQPVPSRAATRTELEALAAVLAEHPGTTLELILPGCLNGFTDDEMDLMTTLSLLANRPANWNVLGVSSMNPGAAEHQLAASDYAAARGAWLVALTLPHTMKIRLSFEHGAILDGLPGWRELFALAPEARLARLADPAERRRLDEGARSKEAGILGALANWRNLRIEETFAPANAAFEGRSVGEVADERGVDPFDVLADVVIADGLRTGLRPPIPESEADWELRAKVWRDERTIVGGSDAGAHLDVMCGAIYSTSLLGDGVRTRGLLSWEEAVHQLTDVPARLYGVRDRGRLTEGSWADVVLFDPDRVGHEPERTRDDLPGGASRLYAEATGIEHVLVNGTEILRAGEATGALPGAVLRSGADTDTVTVPGAPVPVGAP